MSWAAPPPVPSGGALLALDKRHLCYFGSFGSGWRAAAASRSELESYTWVGSGAARRRGAVASRQHLLNRPSPRAAQSPESLRCGDHCAPLSPRAGPQRASVRSLMRSLMSTTRRSPVAMCGYVNFTLRWRADALFRAKSPAPIRPLPPRARANGLLRVGARRVPGGQPLLDRHRG